MEQGQQRISEDWLAVIIGLLVVVLGLLRLDPAAIDIFGWAAKVNVWIDPAKVIGPLTRELVSGSISIFLTFLFLLVLMTAGAALRRLNVLRFAIAFTIVFALSYLCWMAGHYAKIAATPDKLRSFGLTWSLNLTGEAGYIIALVVGLLLGNFMPGAAQRLEDALRPEWYIKTAIVILGAKVGVKSAEQLGLSQQILFRGFCAIVEAYLIYWPVVYLMARKVFKFSREWAAPLASGISICGVSAAIATGAAIRARPVVPIMVSSLVVIFAVVELIVLPFAAKEFLYHEPMVAGAWMGLAVKTDGAAVAAGAVTDSLICAKALEAQGIRYHEGWLTSTATTIKMFIDIFIGIWAFVLAVIWSKYIDRRPGERIGWSEVWRRFPKFVIGYAIAFGLLLFIATRGPLPLAQAKALTDGTDLFRQLFFVLTFFTIGVVSNFRKLWEEGIGRLAAVYVICLFGFIIWVGLLVSFIFFHGIRPPMS
jgi:uncharacterized membrane protein YadS